MKRTRAIRNRLWIWFTFAAVAIAVVPLASILADVVYKGLPSMNINFFTQSMPDPCLNPSSCSNAGGLGPAIQGSFILVALASAIGIPVGIVSGVYVSEYGKNGAYGNGIRFLGDVLAGIPSIVTGVLVYTLVVIPSAGYSVTAGAVALGSMMIPIMSNISTEALKSVPNSIREASTALGARKWRTSLVVVSHARQGLATGGLLAVARITGETAPLILTAGTSITVWFSGLNQPVASLTYYIYYYGTSPYANWKDLAWGGALVLILIVLGINAGVRIMTRGKTFRS